MKTPPPPALWAQKFGTQDFIWLSPLADWKKGERERLLQKIARRSGRPLRRVRFVVAERYRWSKWTRVIEGNKWTFSLRPSIPVTSRWDWLICKVAWDLLNGGRQ